MDWEWRIAQLLELAFIIGLAFYLRIQGKRAQARYDSIQPSGPFDTYLLRCASVFEAIPDGIVVVDSHGVILLVNRELERMSDYHRKKLIGQKIEVLVPESLRPRHITARREYAIDPKIRPMGTGLNTKLQRSDGSAVPVDIALSSEPGEEGTLYIATVRRRL